MSDVHALAVCFLFQGSVFAVLVLLLRFSICLVFFEPKRTGWVCTSGILARVVVPMLAQLFNSSCVVFTRWTSGAFSNVSSKQKALLAKLLSVWNGSISLIFCNNPSQ